MVASRGMRAIRELSLAASLSLAGLALFFGGGPADGSVPWLGGGALLAILALLALRGVPAGWTSVVPLALLAVWCAVSIAWSWLPDRSWDYANRTAVYALFALLGLWASARTRGLVVGLAVVLGAVIGWSLLGKVLPAVYDYGGPDVTRLRGPIGLWNQLALAADFALVLALALRRTFGVLLAYAALVALLLTYSRGGLATAMLVVLVWMALGDDRVESAVCLLAAAIPAAGVVGIAFALPGITSDAQSSHVRWRDGLVFGGCLLVGAAVAVAVWRMPRLRHPRLLRTVASVFVAAAVAAAVVVVLVHGFGSSTPGNTPGRFASTSSNFRLTWWQQAWHGFRQHPLVGTGAGSFHLLNLRFRTIYLDFTIEPHDLPLQFLAELGIVGLVLLVAACAFLLRPSLRRRGHELALALLLPAFLVHSLVDVDWDFAAVAIPAFLAAGAVAGRAAFRPVPAFALLPALGAALLLAGVLFSPWLARRYADDAYAAAPARAVTLADRAHSLDPLLVDPYWAKALAADARGRRQRAFGEYLAAIRRQPHNPQTWLFAGEYAKDSGCWFLAWKYLERYTELDPKARSTSGADDYREALRRVDNHQYTC
jgi:O-antigen ligase/polysaccharide polymerase Wzy-like membrane protein